MTRTNASLPAVLFLLAAAPASHGIELSVEGPEAIVVGEPVVLLVRVTNDGPAAIPDFLLEPGYEIQISIAPPDGEARSFMGRDVVEAMTSERERTLRNPSPVGPGEAREARILLAWDVQKKALPFERPGRHVVRVETSMAGSKPLAIEVAAPEGKAAEALEFLRSHDLGPLLDVETGDEAAGVERLEELAERYADTPYAAGARRSLRILGRGAILAAFPEAIDFGSCPVGETREWLVMVKSNGTRAVAIDGFEGPGEPFRASGLDQELAGEFPPGTLIREFSVFFEPRAPGRYRGRLEFRLGNGETCVIEMRGRAGVE